MAALARAVRQRVSEGASWCAEYDDFCAGYDAPLLHCARPRCGQSPDQQLLKLLDDAGRSYAAEWSKVLQRWKTGGVDGVTTAARLAMLFSYTTNSLPVFFLMNRDAYRSGAERRRRHFHEFHELLHAAAHVQKEYTKGGTTKLFF